LNTFIAGIRKAAGNSFFRADSPDYGVNPCLFFCFYNDAEQFQRIAMFIGHFAVALGAKKAAPEVSLGTFFIASQLVDLLWPLFLLLGLEHVRIAPRVTAFTPLDFYDYPLTHSLASSIGWTVLAGGIYYLIRRDRRGAAVVGAAVFSHWLLDFATHRPDLPLAFGQGPYYGLGLWNSVPATLAVEIALFSAGIWLYWKSTSARDRAGSYGFWALAAFLLIAYFANVFGPLPTDAGLIAVAGNATWLFVVWAYWVDRHRVTVASAAISDTKEKSDG
jgi:hypothetical protein